MKEYKIEVAPDTNLGFVKMTELRNLTKKWLFFMKKTIRPPGLISLEKIVLFSRAASGSNSGYLSTTTTEGISVGSCNLDIHSYP